MNVASLLAAAAAAHPDRPALVRSEPARRGLVTRPPLPDALTFRDLEEAAARVAGALAGHGVGPGDRVLVLVRPSAALFAAVAGVLRQGAAAVFLDRRLLRSGATAAVAAAAPAAILGGPAALALRRLLPGLGAIPVAVAVDAALRAGDPAPAGAGADAHAPALIAFSGGTGGGRARAVVRTHGVLAAQHRALARALPAAEGDVDFTAFPLVTLHNLARGVTTLLPERPFGHPERIDARALWATFARHGVTTASASPPFWEHAAEGWRRCGAPSTLRRIAIGGAPLPPRLPSLLAAIAPRAEIVGVYGSTEVEPVALLRAGERAAAIAARCAAGAGYPLGEPVPEAVVRVAGPDGREAPAGAVGALEVAGPHVARAGAPKGAAGTSGRWHPMGDAAYRAPDGLWLVGRAGAALALEGGALWPGPVEAALEALPFVRRAALVGLPARPTVDRRLQRAALVVVLEPGRRGRDVATEDHAAIAAAWARATASAGGAVAAAPSSVRFVRRLPVERRHHARLDRDALRRRLLARELGTNLALYLRERFPPLAYTLLILSYFGANFLLARAVDVAAGGGAWRFAAGGAALWLMFLHLRIVDEHKDAARDLAVHPDRILSRGLVTLGQLRALGIAAVAAELALSAALGRAALLGCLVVLALTGLIARDFFAPRALERRMLLNAAVHMAIMPAYGLYAYAAATGRPPWAAPGLVLAYAWVGYAVGLALEIARKIRAPGDERPGLITYSAALGPLRAATAMLAALAAAGAISVAVGRALGFGAWYHGAVGVLVALALAGVLDFRRRMDRPSAARLQGYAGTFILAYDVLLVVALARAGGLGPW